MQDIFGHNYQSPAPSLTNTMIREKMAGNSDERSMFMFKKFAAVLCVLGLLLGMAGCGEVAGDIAGNVVEAASAGGEPEACGSRGKAADEPGGWI